MALMMSLVLEKCIWLILVLEGLQGRKCYLNTSDFNELLNESDCFVDKTLLIKEIIENPHKMILITAPPNFGKSVNADTLKKFLEIRATDEPKNNCELFKSKNLSIFRDDRCFFDEHCGRYPVVYADLKSVVGSTYDEILKKFRATVRQSFGEHAYLLKSDELDESLKNEFLRYHSGRDNLDEAEITSALSRLSELLRAHYSASDKNARKVFAVIDNYDCIFSNLNFHYGKTGTKTDMEKSFRFLTYVITNLVQHNRDNLAGALITGRLPLQGLGEIHAKNMVKYPFLADGKFSRFYGLTTGEVKKLADKFDVGHKVKDSDDWYNGYRATSSGNTNDDNDEEAGKIYSVRSVLNYLQTGTYETYWTNDPLIVTPDYWQKLFLEPAVRRVMIDMLDGKDRNVTELRGYGAEDLFDLEETLNDRKKAYYFWPKVLQFMTDYGYFNVLSRTQIKTLETIGIAVPNLDVYKALYNRLYGRLFYKTAVQFDKDAIDCYCRALNSDELIAPPNRESVQKSAFLGLKNSIGTLFSLRDNEDDACGNKSTVTVENEHAFRSALYHAADQCDRLLFDTVAIESGEKYDGKKRRNDLMVIRKDGTAIIVNVKYNDDHSSSEKALSEIVDRNYHKIPDKMEKYKAKVKDRVYVGLYFHGPKRLIYMSYLVNNIKEKEHFCV